jgi:DHA1 family multidrug resistance protein-like MFS transporter
METGKRRTIVFKRFWEETSDRGQLAVAERSVIRDVLSIYIPAFFVMTGMSIVSPILSIYAKSFDVSYTLATLAISIYAIGRLCTNLPVGVLGDRIGRRPVLLAGALILTVSAFLCAHAGSFWELVLYRLLQGVGSSMWQTMRATMLQDILKPEERGRILGYFQTFVLIGSSAGPTIGGVVAETWGIRAPFYAYGLGGLASFVLSYVLIAEPESSRIHMENLFSEAKGYSWDVVRRLLRNTNFCAACIATFTTFFMRTGLRSTLIPLYGDGELNLTTAEIGYAISFSTFTNLFITIPIGYALDRFGRKAILVPSLLASAFVALIFPFTNSFTQLAVACVLLGLSTGGGGQAPLAMASDATMNEPHGLSMGLYRVFGDIGFIIGPLMVGVIADTYGLRPPFYAISLLIFASVILVQLAAKETLPRKKT